MLLNKLPAPCGAHVPALLPCSPSSQVPAFCWSHPQGQREDGCSFFCCSILSFPLQSHKSPSLLFPGTARSGSDHVGWAVVPPNTTWGFAPAGGRCCTQGGCIRAQVQPRCPRAWLSRRPAAHIPSTSSEGGSILQRRRPQPAPPLPNPVQQRT